MTTSETLTAAQFNETTQRNMALVDWASWWPVPCVALTCLAAGKHPTWCTPRSTPKPNESASGRSDPIHPHDHGLQEQSEVAPTRFARRRRQHRAWVQQLKAYEAEAAKPPPRNGKRAQQLRPGARRLGCAPTLRGASHRRYRSTVSLPVEHPRPEIAQITLVRWKRMNSMAFDVSEPLKEAFSAGQLRQLGAVAVLTGAGSRAFRVRITSLRGWCRTSRT